MSSRLDRQRTNRSLRNLGAANLIAKGLIGILTVALCTGSLWWLVSHPMFTLNGVIIRSTQGSELRYIHAELVRVTTLPRIKGNFFTTDLRQAREAIELHGWVRSASVRRKWPNKLIFTVEEHTPIGMWGHDGYIVSDKGAIFMANLGELEENGEMLQFNGPNGTSEAVVSRYIDLRNILGQAKLLPVEITLSDRLAWTVRLHNGTVLELGRDETGDLLKERADRLVSVYPQLISRLGRPPDVVDLRYPNGFAITAKGLKINTKSETIH